MSTLPEVRVGDPIRHESLAVFPLFSTVDARVDYLLSDEAIRCGIGRSRRGERGGFGSESPRHQPAVTRGSCFSKARNCAAPSRTAS